jgi:pyruvate carboxylase
MPPLDFNAINENLRVKFGNSIREVDVVSYSQYPKVSSAVINGDDTLCTTACMSAFTTVYLHYSCRCYGKNFLQN